MSNKQTLRASYVQADDLYVNVQGSFDSFEKWREFELGNPELINGWEDERTFRIVEGAKSGLINEVLKGNASAVNQLKSLLGFSRPVGRPKGSTNLDEDHKQAIENKLIEDFNSDIERLG